MNELGHLEIGGCDIVEVARDYETPAYIYAEHDIRAQARAYLEAFRGRADSFEVLFASKAAPFTAAFKLLAEEGLSVDVASGGELFMALKAEFDPDRIYMHGNNKSRKELEYAFESEIGHLVLDSFDEIQLADELLTREQDVLIRVTPGVDTDTHGAMRTGQSDTKFGFGLTNGQARAAREAINSSRHLRYVGLHAHIGSQIYALQDFEREITALASLADEDCQILNVGGGLGIAYRNDDTPPTIEDYVTTVIDAVNEHFPDSPRILIEPGRSLVGNAGVTAYMIGSKKKISESRTYVAVDGGMSDNLRPMLYKASYEALIASRPLAKPTETVSVVGKHCETGDNLISAIDLPDPAVGDILITPVTGAYGHSMANNYNGVPRPPIIFCADGDAREVVRRERYEDLASRDR